mmetsp:Transcript_33809/g.49690  ORF Transcript_33809/g.49690 Transcript_33809/m.49690 type:complete len:206 (+) Transcript_33809:134-751(+)
MPDQLLESSWNNLFSMLLVGAVWGCSNPFLRKGSSTVLSDKQIGGDIKARTQRTRDEASTTEIANSSRGGLSVTNCDKQTSADSIATSTTNIGIISALWMKIKSLSQFQSVRVWLPYLLNQSGSIIYYRLLATSDLTLAVPSCNALALVFSAIMSYLLGERLDCPGRVAIGSILVTTGVFICVSSSNSGASLSSPPSLTDERNEL